MNLPFDRQVWMKESACVESDPELWFPEQGGSPETAKMICSMCPVVEECLAYALSAPQLSTHGVYGGLTARERQQLRKVPA